MIKRFLILVLLFVFLLTVVACQTAVSTPTSQPTALSIQPSATSPQPTETSIPTPIPTPQPPTPTITPAPLKIGVDTAVPVELKTAVQAIVQNNPQEFIWTEEDSEMVLGVNEEAPIANWIFAVAAPFPTFADEIALDDVQMAWQDGRLTLTSEMDKILRGWWGEPAVDASIVAPNELIQNLWQTQTSYDEPQLTILPFEQLDPRLKVLAVDGNSPISVDYDEASYALSLPLGWVGEEAITTDWQLPRSNRHDDQITHITMTGPSGLSRAVADRMEKYGFQYPGEVIGPILRAADIAHMSHENAFAPDCPPPQPTGGTTFCAQPKTIELMTWMGVDVEELIAQIINDTPVTADA